MSTTFLHFLGIPDLWRFRIAETGQQLLTNDGSGNFSHIFPKVSSLFVQTDSFELIF